MMVSLQYTWDSAKKQARAPSEGGFSVFVLGRSATEARGTVALCFWAIGIESCRPAKVAVLIHFIMFLFILKVVCFKCIW